MKLLILSLNHAPEEIGIGKYQGELAAWLQAHGHSVRVIAAPPYYPQWRLAKGYRRFWWSREELEGVWVTRAPLYVPKKASGLRRALHLFSFAASATPPTLWQALTWRPDAVMTVAPAMTSAPLAWIAAKLAFARSWINVQDFEVEAAFSLGLAKGKALQRLALAIEGWLLRRFDVASSISPKMVLHLKAKGVLRTWLFRNWVDCRDIRPLEQPSAFRSELGIGEDQRVLLYAGNLSLKQGLEILGPTIDILAPRGDVVFVLAGEGTARRELESQLAGKAAVRFLPLQPQERLNELLNLADIHLLPQREGAADLVLPSKLTGMLASGRPIVATAAPGTGLAEALDGVGRITPPGDAEAFAQALAGLLDRPEEIAKLGRAARERALQIWDKAAILGAFEGRLTELVEGGRLAPFSTLE